MSRRSLKQDKIAKVYDSEILPLWTRRFARLLLQCVSLPEKAMVLEVGCRTGHLSLELIRKMGGHGRIIALESSGPLLDVARAKADDLSGRRIFFRTERLTGKLSFADDVYDLTCSNVGLDEVEAPLETALAEMVRVTKPGGQVVVSLPLRGTWQEFLDIYREVLIKQDRDAILARLEDWVDEHLPDMEQARAMMVRAGLKDVSVQSQRFGLLFRSAREFFFAPVIEYGPLKTWKDLSGKGQEMQDIFWYIKEAIDSYFSETAFSVTVVAGCLFGVKPLPEDVLDLDSEDVVEEMDVHEIQEVEGMLSEMDANVGDDEDDMDIRTTAPVLEKKQRKRGFFGPEVVATVPETYLDEYDLPAKGGGGASGAGPGFGEEDFESDALDDDGPTLRPDFIDGIDEDGRSGS